MTWQPNNEAAHDRLVAQAKRMMRKADAAGHTLFVNLGRPGLAARRQKELMALVRDCGRMVRAAKTESVTRAPSKSCAPIQRVSASTCAVPT